MSLELSASALPLLNVTLSSTCTFDGITYNASLCADGDMSTLCATDIVSGAWLSVLVSASTPVGYVHLYPLDDDAFHPGNLELWTGANAGDTAVRCGESTSGTADPIVVWCGLNAGPWLTVLQVGSPPRLLSFKEVVVYGPPTPSRPPALPPLPPGTQQSPFAPPPSPPPLPALPIDAGSSAAAVAVAIVAALMFLLGTGAAAMAGRCPGRFQFKKGTHTDRYSSSCSTSHSASTAQSDAKHGAHFADGIVQEARESARDSSQLPTYGTASCTHSSFELESPDTVDCGVQLELAASGPPPEPPPTMTEGDTLPAGAVEWFYFDCENRLTGPVPQDEIDRLYADGAIHLQTFVWSPQREGNWAALSTILSSDS